MSDIVDRKVRQFCGVLIFSGLFNIVLSAPLMVPEFYTHYLRILCKLNAMLLLGGLAPVVPSGGVSVLFLNMADIDLVPIAIFVFYASIDHCRAGLFRPHLL